MSLLAALIAAGGAVTPGCVGVVPAGPAPDSGSAVVDASAAEDAGSADVAKAPADATSTPADAGSPDVATVDSGPPALDIERVGATLDIPTVAGTNKRHADVAFDPVHSVYLVVHGSAPVGGAFVDSDGVPIGSPFTICQTSEWTQSPSLAWFPAAGAFLVVWHDTREDPNAARLRGRLVGFDGAAVRFPGADFPISVDPSYQEVAASLACAPAAAECLVVWTRSTTTLAGQRLDAAGALLGAAIEPSPSDWNGDAAVAIAPGSDTFLVAHTHADASGASVTLRQLRQGTGAVVGSALTLGRAGGTWASLLQWDSVQGRFLTGWWDGAARGLFLAADGTPQGAALPLVPGYGSYDGLALAFNPVAGLFAVALHGPTAEDFAALVGPDGASGAPREATASPAGTSGNFNPRLAAHLGRREWLLVTVRDYATVRGQRLRAP